MIEDAIKLHQNMTAKILDFLLSVIQNSHNVLLAYIASKIGTASYPPTDNLRVGASHIGRNWPILSASQAP